MFFICDWERGRFLHLHVCLKHFVQGGILYLGPLVVKTFGSMNDFMEIYFENPRKIHANRRKPLMGSIIQVHSSLQEAIYLNLFLRRRQLARLFLQCGHFFCTESIRSFTKLGIGEIMIAYHSSPA